ncbi:M23 family metallopeptidase [Corynebacterium freneyi]|uniref:peptidoglycan DD-metalloendopeptidase family protein n=1 Tax=Corynebacterium TaxID=1716 RepID=UPI000A558FD3|nr:M23 family metallopeptidase [Corynebacterium freneyi]
MTAPLQHTAIRSLARCLCIVLCCSLFACISVIPESTVADAAPRSGGISAIEHAKPVPGDVVTPYDPPAQRWLPGHRGVDLAAPIGSAVRASGDGVVHFAGMVAGTPTVSVMHADGIRTTYQPVRWSVRRGDRVRRGDVIGTLEAGQDPGLHWGALRGRDYLNPLDLLWLRPIVLKPVE